MAKRDTLDFNAFCAGVGQPCLPAGRQGTAESSFLE
jgi:hypothetical protein